MTTRVKKLLIVVGLVSTIITLALLYFTGQNINYAVQSKYFDNIRTIASIIFGVTGAWLAITYPKALSSASAARLASSENRDAALSRASEDSEVLIGFVKTMIISIIIIAISLTIPFLKEILSMFQWALDIKEHLRGFLYSLLGITTVIQLLLLGLTLKNTYRALKELNSETAEAITRAERDRNSER